MDNGLGSWRSTTKLRPPAQISYDFSSSYASPVVAVNFNSGTESQRAVSKSTQTASLDCITRKAVRS